MIDLTDKTTEEAAREFARQVLYELYHYDLDALERLIDHSDFPLQEQFPAPVDQVRYADPDEISDWDFHLEKRDDGGYDCHFDIPFSDPDYEPVIADFELTHIRNSLSVRLIQVSPS